MDTERFDTHFVGNLNLYGSENAERLRALAETPLRRATATYPRHVGNHLGMLRYDFECVLAVKIQIVGHIKRKRCASRRMAAEIMTVEFYTGISPHSLKVDEVALAVDTPGHVEHLDITCIAVEIAVGQLAIAIVIIPVVGHIDCLCRILVIVEPCCPALVETDVTATAGGRTFGETDCRATHRFACSHCDATLIRIVDSTIEMIHHSVMLHKVALVGKQFVELLGRINQIIPFPVIPCNKIIAACESIESLIGTRRVESGEIEHHIDVAHLDNLCVACDCALRLVCEHRIPGITTPFCHVVRQSYSDTLTLHAGFGIDTSGIVIHDETRTECLVRIFIDRAFIFSKSFPPLHVLIVYR